jgi:two-component system, NarL family, response regulator LiaR
VTERAPVPVQTPEPARGPIRLAVVNDFAVVVAGVATMLAPFRERVQVVELDIATTTGGEVDLVLYDTFGVLRDPAWNVESIVAVTGAKVVVFSWLTEPELVRRTLAAGASGFVSKTIEPGPLVDRLERIHRGEIVVPDPGPRSLTLRGGDWPGADAGLTAREAEIITLVVSGLSNKEIASTMFLSINSVKTYIRTAYRKIGVTTRTQAVLWGVRNGFQPAVGASEPVPPPDRASALLTELTALTGRTRDR